MHQGFHYMLKWLHRRQARKTVCSDLCASYFSSILGERKGESLGYFGAYCTLVPQKGLKVSCTLLLRVGNTTTSALRWALVTEFKFKLSVK